MLDKASSCGGALYAATRRTRRAVEPDKEKVKNMNLMHGDCLELMKDIPDGSVDMVLCDLPYNKIDCKWDVAFPLHALWNQYKRIIRKNGVIALFGSEPFSTKLRMRNFEWFKYDWVWSKNTCTGFLHAKNMPLQNYEIISCFSAGSIGHENKLGDHRMMYNPQGIVKINKVCSSKRKFGGAFGQRPSHKEKYVQKVEHYPRTILNFHVPIKKEHPNQKPVPLLEYLVRTYTNPGMTVLDNCMGSGSTGVACVNTGRDFIGMELDLGYFETAKRRIEEAQKRIVM